MGLWAVFIGGLAAVLLAGAVLAEGPVDPRALEVRMNPPRDPALTLPGGTKRLTLEGCALRMDVTGTKPGDWARSEVLWLGDLQTDPQKKMRREYVDGVEALAAWGGPKEMVIYYWRLESLIAHEDDILRWILEYERIRGPAVIAGDDSISPDQRAEARRVRSAGMRVFHEAALAGAYGPMLQRNQIATDGVAVVRGAEKTLAPYFAVDMIIPRIWYKSETAESPWKLLLPKAAAEGVVNDLHRYALQECPGVGE